MLVGLTILKNSSTILSLYLTEYLKQFGNFIFDLTKENINIDKISLKSLFRYFETANFTRILGRPGITMKATFLFVAHKIIPLVYWLFDKKLSG
jgi:hypothetical protein